MKRVVREITTTITQRGQVTLPAEVQRLLGLRPRDKVTFAIDQGQVRLVPARFTLESAAGSVEPPTRTEDLERIIHEAKEERAARVVRELEPTAHDPTLSVRVETVVVVTVEAGDGGLAVLRLELDDPHSAKVDTGTAT